MHRANMSVRTGIVWRAAFLVDPVRPDPAARSFEGIFGYKSERIKVNMHSQHVTSVSVEAAESDAQNCGTATFAGPGLIQTNLQSRVELHKTALHNKHSLGACVSQASKAWIGACMAG
jgi:hypothetical protein